MTGIATLSVNGLNEIRMQEGRALRAYQDAVGVWTVGYGLTNYDKGLPWRVAKGLVITEAEAEYYLYHSLVTNYEPDVRQVLHFDKLAHPQGAVDGGDSFHFNTGGIKKAQWPRYLNAGNLSAARASFESWNKAGGRVLADLVRRRATEWGIISAEQYGHLTGPTVVVPNASNRESYRGHGDLLTALPTSPGAVVSPAKTNPAEIPPAASAPGALKLGDKGDEVTDLQHKINAAGGDVPVTGVFDQATLDAVKKFQGSHPNLTVDGKVGPATDAALDRAKQLTDATKNVGKVAAPAVPGAFVAFHQFVSAHAGEIALGVGFAVVAGIAVYLLWHYRHDLTAKLNSAVGRTVA